MSNPTKHMHTNARLPQMHNTQPIHTHTTPRRRGRYNMNSSKNTTQEIEYKHSNDLNTNTYQYQDDEQNMTPNIETLYPTESYKFLLSPPKNDSTHYKYPKNMQKDIKTILEDKTMNFFKNTLIRTVKGYEIGAELLFMISIAGVAKTHYPHQTVMIRNIIKIMIQQIQKDYEIDDDELGEYMVIYTLDELERQHEEKNGIL
jgi:hypothetical protein